MEAPSLDSRLSQISTLWTALRNAHAESPDAATTRQRLLMERYPDTGTATTFLVEPGASPNQCRVTIRTEMQTQRGGLFGKLERFFTLRFLQPVFREELQNINRVASTGA